MLPLKYLWILRQAVSRPGGCKMSATFLNFLSRKSCGHARKHVRKRNLFQVGGIVGESSVCVSLTHLQLRIEFWAWPYHFFSSVIEICLEPALICYALERSWVVLRDVNKTQSHKTQVRCFRVEALKDEHNTRYILIKRVTQNYFNSLVTIFLSSKLLRILEWSLPFAESFCLFETRLCYDDV